MRPSFFLTAPARNPLTLCGCQPVADCRSSIVAPLGRASRIRQALCFVFRLSSFVFRLASCVLRLPRLQSAPGLAHALAPAREDGASGAAWPTSAAASIEAQRSWMFWLWPWGLGSGCTRRWNWRPHHPKPRKSRGEPCSVGLEKRRPMPIAMRASRPKSTGIDVLQRRVYRGKRTQFTRSARTAGQLGAERTEPGTPRRKIFHGRCAGR